MCKGQKRNLVSQISGWQLCQREESSPKRIGQCWLGTKGSQSSSKPIQGKAFIGETAARCDLHAELLQARLTESERYYEYTN